MALWGASEQASGSSSQAKPAKESAPSAPVRPVEPLRPEEGASVVLDRSTRVEGKLSFEGSAQVAGNFTGEIRSRGRLRVEEGARVQAEISVGTAIILGEVLGNIQATEAVELRKSARLRGNIETPTLHIELGAVFEGACKMDRDAPTRPAKKS
ncbi:MAG: polymer-forming cytoskeletal protein [Deltaproteobacteria bacterium]|nr:polymer-forming cytoskeletal protein [Deltaproteobacteria bacterium]